MTCWGKLNAMWHFISTLFCWCFSVSETLIEELHEAWDIQSCLFALKLVVKRREGGVRCVTAQTQEPELIAAAQVNAWVGFISACFWTVPEMALQGIYSVICHATSKTAKTPFIIWISWRKINKSVCTNSLVVSVSTHSATVLTATWVRFSSRGPLPILLPAFLSSLYCRISIKKPIKKKIYIFCIRLKDPYRNDSVRISVPLHP